MAKDPQQGLFPRAVEMLILRTLKPQGQHGYALVQDIQRNSNNLLQIQGGTVYAALRRLLNANLVRAEWGASSANRRVWVYKLTKSGARRLDGEVSRFERMLEGIMLAIATGKAQSLAAAGARERPESSDFSDGERAGADSECSPNLVDLRGETVMSDEEPLDRYGSRCSVPRLPFKSAYRSGPR